MVLIFQRGNYSNSFYVFFKIFGMLYARQQCYCIRRSFVWIVFSFKITSLRSTVHSELYLPSRNTSMFTPNCKMMSHKEERFIYFLYPPLCFFCSVAAFWMLQETFVVSPSQYLQSMNAPEEVLQALRNTAMPQRFITKSSAKRIPRGKTLSSLPPSIPVSQEPINVHTPSKSQQQKIPRRVLILLGILVFYVFSGL